jgi:hypothetical protein
VPLVPLEQPDRRDTPVLLDPLVRQVPQGQQDILALPAQPEIQGPLVTLDLQVLLAIQGLLDLRAFRETLGRQDLLDTRDPPVIPALPVLHLRLPALRVTPDQLERLERLEPPDQPAHRVLAEHLDTTVHSSLALTKLQQ